MPTRKILLSDLADGAREIMAEADRAEGMDPELAADAYRHLALVLAYAKQEGHSAPATRGKRTKTTARKPTTTTAGMFVVNIARGQDRLVPSLAEASRAVRYYLQTNGIGGSKWTGTGLVHDHTGKPVAMISYNGRAWRVDARGRPTGHADQDEIQFR